MSVVGGIDLQPHLNACLALGVWEEGTGHAAEQEQLVASVEA